MLKKILKAIAFLCVLALLLSVCSLAVYPKSNQKARKYNEAGIFAEPANTLDYVCIGDSNISEGVCPLDIWNTSGAAGYTCAEPWQTLAGCYYMLEKIFKTQHPSLVLLDTDSFFLGQGKVKGSDDIVRVTMEEMLPVFRYHDNWKKLTLQTLFTKPKNSWQDANRGHALSKTISADVTGDNMEVRRHYFEGIALPLHAYMRAIIDLCEKNGAEILVVSVPCPTIWSETAHNAIQSYTDSLGLSYLDLNEYEDEIGIDWSTDTRDGGTHLNVFGAQKLSLFLSQYLAQNYTLGDHRGDASYARWDTDYASYASYVATP